jgi:predicted Zn-dependent protease
VLFSPDVARGLIGSFLGAMRGGSQYRRSSFLLNAAGERVFPEWFAISERPHLHRALGSAPFDHEGVATRDRELVTAGVALGYVLSTYSARKLGLKTTGNAGGTHNVLVHSRERDFDAMLALMDRGLLVTELMGQGVNGVTGDYSRGATGFWVENGKLAYPVHEVTIAGNLKDMYREIVDVGTDIDQRGWRADRVDTRRADDDRRGVSGGGASAANRLLPAPSARARTRRRIGHQVAQRLVRDADAHGIVGTGRYGISRTHRARLGAPRIRCLVTDRIEDRGERDASRSRAGAIDSSRR